MRFKPFGISFLAKLSARFNSQILFITTDVFYFSNKLLRVAIETTVQIFADRLNLIAFSEDPIYVSLFTFLTLLPMLVSESGEAVFMTPLWLFKASKL